MRRELNTTLYKNETSSTVICADSRIALKDYEGQADLIVTSPPYADARDKHYDSIHPDDFAEWFLTFHRPFFNALKPTGSLIINIKDKVVDGVRHRYVWHMVEALNRHGWFSIEDYIWHKTNPMPGRWPTRLRDGWEYCFHLSKTKRPYFNPDAVKQPVGDWVETRLKKLGQGDLSRHNSVNKSGFGRDVSRWVGKAEVLPSNVLSAAVVGKNKNHPAVFPLSLPLFFIKLLCPPEGVVIDPFGGSGTTGIAALQLARRSILIDNNPQYCEAAIQRLRDEAGAVSIEEEPPLIVSLRATSQSIPLRSDEGVPAISTAKSSKSPRKRAKKQAIPQIELIHDPVQAAEAAHLVYVTDNKPGITRKKAGKGFSYTAPDGKPIRDKATITRINALAIPPAYTDVWISPNPDGHIQATGRDERGRKQYRYHPRWAEQRESNKFSRMILFGEALPGIRRRLDEDMKQKGLPRTKVLAAVVALLGETFIRVGNEEYARTNESYGLTTLQDEHADVHGGTVTFTFRGKSGKDHAITLKDVKLAKVVKASQDLPGQHLFQYKDEDGHLHAVTSGDVNAYLKEIAGEGGEAFTAKDFRTWGGTTLAVAACNALGSAEGLNKGESKRRITQMIRDVAERLGNTPTVCRKYYVHPAIAEAYLAGTLLPMLEARTSGGETPDPYDLETAERVVIEVLRAAREKAAEETAKIAN